MRPMEKNTPEHTIDEIFSRGVSSFIDPGGSFRKKLLAKAQGKYKKNIIVKFGVDPTRPDIHLGHAVILRKLRKLQDIGCTIVFLIGDFTAQIGDPTGKSKVRPELDHKEVEANLRTYLEQVDKILRVDRDPSGSIKDSPYFSWMRNSEWYVGVTDLSVDSASTQGLSIRDDRTGQVVTVPGNSFLAKAALYENTRMQKGLLHHATTHGLSLINLLSLLRRIPYAQLIERDMFQERIKKGEPLFMHEMLYPVIQGADSHMLADIYGSCDLEVGGTDQTFNMLMGRKIMEMVGKEPQAVAAFEVLVGLDGKDKMSKSLGNYIGITDAPNDMYGKIMSLPDAAIVSYYEMATFTPITDVRAIAGKLTDGKINPRDIKMELARQIVAIYHGEDSAKTALCAFVETFQKGKLPEDVRSHKTKTGTLLADAVLASGIVASKGEFRRLVDEGAVVEWESEKVSDPLMPVSRTIVLKIGKRRFLKIETEH